MARPREQQTYSEDETHPSAISRWPQNHRRLEGWVQPGNRFASFVSFVRKRALFVRWNWASNVTRTFSLSPFSPSRLSLFPCLIAGFPFSLQWSQVKSSEFKWNQVKSSGTEWIQVKPSEMKWNQVKSSENKWSQVRNKGNQVKSSEINWIQAKPS